MEFGRGSKASIPINKMARKNITDKQVCEVYAKTMKQGTFHRFPYEILSEETGECEKVCYSAIERAYNREYIEYGVSLRTGWLTEKGKKLLNEKSNSE